MEASPPDFPTGELGLMRFRGRLVSYRSGNHAWPVNMAEKISWEYETYPPSIWEMS